MCNGSIYRRVWKQRKTRKGFALCIGADVWVMRRSKREEGFIVDTIARVTYWDYKMNQRVAYDCYYIVQLDNGQRVRMQSRYLHAI